MNFALRLGIVESLARYNFCVCNEIVSKSVRNVSEILTIQTDIEHVERTVIVEMGNVRNFTSYSLVTVCALSANPVLIILHPRLLALYLSSVGILKSHSNVIDII